MPETRAGKLELELKLAEEVNHDLTLDNISQDADGIGKVKRTRKKKKWGRTRKKEMWGRMRKNAAPGLKAALVDQKTAQTLIINLSLLRT